MLVRKGQVGEDIVLAAMAHARRKIVDVFVSLGNAIAEKAVCRIVELYAMEKDERGETPGDRLATRQLRAKPTFEVLEVWQHAQLPKTSGKSPLSQAICYAHGRMPKARRYIKHGYLELGNNTAERHHTRARGSEKLNVRWVRGRGQSDGYRL